MATLRIEHTVHDYDNWKQQFDNDPADRKGSGVRSYRVSRSASEPNHVFIDLDFDDSPSAQKMLDKLQEVWAGPAMNLIVNPSATIVEQVESVDL